MCTEVAQPAGDPVVVSVRLVETSTIPGRVGRFVDAVVEAGFEEGAEVLFEPDSAVLKELGASLY